MKSAIMRILMAGVLVLGGVAFAEEEIQVEVVTVEPAPAAEAAPEPVAEEVEVIAVIEEEMVVEETVDAAAIEAEQRDGVWWGNRSISYGNYLKFDRVPASECPYGCPHCRGSKRCCERGPDCTICDFENGPCFVCPPMYFDKIFFDLDKSFLRPEGIEECNKIVAYMNAHPDVNVVIEGHTCDLAPTDYNIGLGQRRASSVERYLQEQGIAASRMRTKTFGESTPWVGIPQRELNRRAIVVVVDN